MASISMDSENKEVICKAAMCGVCFDWLVEPYIRSCGHSFCGKCTKKLVSKECPGCKDSSTRLPIRNYSLDELVSAIRGIKSTYGPLADDGEKITEIDLSVESSAADLKTSMSKSRAGTAACTEAIWKVLLKADPKWCAKYRVSIASGKFISWSCL